MELEGVLGCAHHLILIVRTVKLMRNVLFVGQDICFGQMVLV